MPVPNAKYFGNGITIEAMGAVQIFASAQAAVEGKVRKNAEELQHAPYGYRPAVGFQYARLVAPIEGPSYGSSVNAFTDATPLTPPTIERFEKHFERRAPGYTKVDTIEKPEEIPAFDSQDTYGYKVNGVHKPSASIKVSA
jgi:hypothetical protein